MKRHIALIITLSHLFGTLGAPVIAFSCAESGEVGVVSYLAGSPKPCYADACCDDVPDPVSDRGQSCDLPEPRNNRVQNDAPCCNLSVEIAAESSRILLPGHKYGPDSAFVDTPARVNAPLPNVCLASTCSFVSIFCPPIDLPLII